jgi:ABC-2 type transport system permease protein
LKTILILIAKEFRLFRSDMLAVSLTFIVPVALILMWGSIFGNSQSAPEHLRMAFLNRSKAPIAARIEKVLDTSRTFSLIKSYKDENGNIVPFDTVSIKEYVRKGNAAAALVVPEDAYTDTSFGLRLKFYYDPRNEMEIQIIQGMLQQTIMSQLPEIFLNSGQRYAQQWLGADSGRAFNTDIAKTVSKYFNVDMKDVLDIKLNDTSSVFGGNSGGDNNFFKNILRLDKEQLVGKDITNPWATRSVGGWAMMFLLFTLNASAVSLFEEKQNGVILRILASPISRDQVLWSKYLFNVSLGCVQLVVLFMAGAILFKIDVFSNMGNLLLVMLFASAACTAFGMLLAAVSKTPGQARALGTLLILAMSSIGGAWFPTSFMPPFMQTLAKGSIVYWSMDGFMNVLWRGVGLLDILPDLGVLTGISLAITVISVWRFRRGHVF